MAFFPADKQRIGAAGKQIFSVSSAKAALYFSRNHLQMCVTLPPMSQVVLIPYFSHIFVLKRNIASIKYRMLCFLIKTVFIFFFILFFFSPFTFLSSESLILQKVFPCLTRSWRKTQTVGQQKTLTKPKLN